MMHWLGFLAAINVLAAWIQGAQLLVGWTWGGPNWWLVAGHTLMAIILMGTINKLEQL